MEASWLTPAQCADDLGVTRQHIHDLIAQGKIKAKQFSPKVTRISRAEWERFQNGTPDIPASAAPAA